MAVLGLGLAALGRPAYLNVGHGADLGPDRSVEALRARCWEVCDAAWAGGLHWFDVARSYGLGEQFLASWLSARAVPAEGVTVSSKWGYTYTAGWRTDAETQEVKDHRAPALARQWPESELLLGQWLRLYQVHSATLDSGVLDDTQVHEALAALPVPVGLSLSGPRQADTLRRALQIEVHGRHLFSAVQATWNVLEPSAGPALTEAKAAGWTVIVKEALANGRLTTRQPEPTFNGALGPRPDVTALAAALAQPWVDVVLSGASTVDQLRSNLDAVAAVADVPLDRLAELAVPPESYWASRSAMTWT